jgi:hypothetical protein
MILKFFVIIYYVNPYASPAGMKSISARVFWNERRKHSAGEDIKP